MQLEVGHFFSITSDFHSSCQAYDQRCHVTTFSTVMTVIVVMTVTRTTADGITPQTLTGTAHHIPRNQCTSKDTE